MLASQQHGISLITEKLQNQHLEEPVVGVTPSNVASVSSSSSYSFSNKNKHPQINQEVTNQISDNQAKPLLAVKGKNVWALSREAEKKTSKGSTHQHPFNTSTSLHQSHQSSSLHLAGAPSVDFKYSFSSSQCRHKKWRHYCHICDGNPGTPSAPPKKKHCRSLSVPPDVSVSFFPSGKDATSPPTTRFSIGTTAGYSSHHHHHQPQHGVKIWRPIAVVPLRCNTTPMNKNSNKATKSATNQISRKIIGHQNKERHNSMVNFGSFDTDNDEISYDLDNHPSLHSTVSSRKDHITSSFSSSGSLRDSYSSSSLFKFKLVPPSSFSSSSGSFDSGHFTATSDVQTPPSSPIPHPRPASATSDTISLNNSSILAMYDFGGPLQAGRRVPGILQNRSLSYEDKISSCCSSTCCCRSPSSSTLCMAATSMPCVYNRSSNTNFMSGEDGSTCCVHHHDGTGGGCEVVPRCHSQPCVLHHRRIGKKRRRDCDNRPTLNFNKMTETAYTHCRSDPWSYNIQDPKISLWQSHTNLEGQHSQFFLNTIASSPLDSSEPLMSKHLQPYKPPLIAATAPLVDQSGVSSHGGYLPLHRNLSIIDKISMEDQEEDHDYDDEDDKNCSCHENIKKEADNIEPFSMADLDLEQIETH